MTRSESNGGSAAKPDPTATLPPQVAEIATDLGQKATDAARSSVRGLDEALRRLDEESEGSLTVGAAFSMGLACGVLLGGGPRLLALVAGAPGIAMSLTLLRRAEAARRSKGPTR